MDKSKMTRFTKFFLDLLFYSGFVVCATLPWSMKILGDYFDIYRTYFVSMMVIFEAAGIAGIYILWCLRRIFRLVLQKSCFVDETVTHLKHMGISAFLIVVLMACRLFFEITPSILVLMLVFFIAGLFSFVLALVFREANAYKKENDLTI